MAKKGSLSWFSTRATRQSQPIPGAGQVPNSAGGHAWEIDSWSRLRRFLILGVDGPTYYASEHRLVKENAEAVLCCIVLDGSARSMRLLPFRFPVVTRSSSRWCLLLPRVPPPKTLTRGSTR